jgi:hypothetical protein
VVTAFVARGRGRYAPPRLLPPRSWTSAGDPQSPGPHGASGVTTEAHEAQLGPTWYNAWLGRPQEAQRQVIRDVAAQHDLRLHRVNDVVATLPPAEPLLDGMHLTRAGHAAVGP